MDILYFLRVLLRRKWLILFITVVAVVATYFVTNDSNQTYKSAAQLATGIVDNPKDDGGYVHPQKIESKFNNMMEVITSKPVVNQLSYKLALHDINSDDPFRNSVQLRDQFSENDINNAIISFKLKNDTLGALAHTRADDRELMEILETLGYDYGSLVQSISVSRVKETDYLRVEAKTSHPELSAFIANTLCDEFIRYYESIKTERQTNSVAFYNSQVDEKLRTLNEKKEELNQFKLNNNIVDLNEQTSSILKQIRDLEVSREQEKKKIPSYRQTIQNLDRNLEGVESYEDIQAKNKTINNLRNEINYLNDKYISGGSKDKKLEEQIEKLKSELRAMINNAASSSNYVNPNESKKELVDKKVENEIELEIARSSVASIDKEIQRLKNELAVLVSLEPQVTAMQREINVAEQEYLNAVNKLSSAKTSSLTADNLIRQTDFAAPADKPEPTKQVFYSLFSGMLSFSFCIVMIFVLEYLDFSIKTPAQFKKFTNLNLIGYLNQINFINFDLDVNFIDINLESIFHNKNDNQQLETFKQLIRKVRFEVESSDAKRFLVTSTREGEGKTFFITSLAYSLSLNNKKVLIVDTNFKNNTLTNMLAAKPAFEKHFNQELVKEDIITKSKLRGIDIIGCYEGNYSPSEVFSQTNFQNLINDLAQNYDFIFLEGAALNEYSDSKELISSVEKVISVFSTSTVIKEEDKASIAYLRGLNDRFMGAVLNKVDLENMNMG